jgi:hypothetical protein
MYDALLCMSVVLPLNTIMPLSCNTTQYSKWGQSPNLGTSKRAMAKGS